MIVEKVNHDVSRKVFGSKNFENSPSRINFYHMSLAGGGMQVRHYFWHLGKPGDKDEVVNQLPAISARGSAKPGGITIDDALAKIAAIAHEDTDGQSPWLRQDSASFQDKGASYDGVLWRWRSYIAFMFDDPNWDVAPQAGGLSAIRFDPTRADFGNHSFFDGFDTTVDVGSGTKRSVTCILNHMKKDDSGADLAAADGIQRFKFDIHLDVMLAGNSKPTRIVIDPGGGNQGPPK